MNCPCKQSTRVPCLCKPLKSFVRRAAFVALFISSCLGLGQGCGRPSTAVEVIFSCGMFVAGAVHLIISTQAVQEASAPSHEHRPYSRSQGLYGLILHWNSSCEGREICRKMRHDWVQRSGSMAQLFLAAETRGESLEPVLQGDAWKG